MQLFPSPCNPAHGSVFSMYESFFSLICSLSTIFPSLPLPFPSILAAPSPLYPYSRLIPRRGRLWSRLAAPSSSTPMASGAHCFVCVHYIALKCGHCLLASYSLTPFLVFSFELSLLLLTLRLLFCPPHPPHRCALPGSFPENIAFTLMGGKKLVISYPGAMLNIMVRVMRA